MDAETGQGLVFLTNNFALPALTIALLYKRRWKVELFFKWIKQHLRIKHFYGTSDNAGENPDLDFHLCLTCWWPRRRNWRGSQPEPLQHFADFGASTLLSNRLCINYLAIRLLNAQRTLLATSWYSATNIRTVVTTFD